MFSNDNNDDEYTRVFNVRIIDFLVHWPKNRIPNIILHIYIPTATINCSTGWCKERKGGY